jgi:succinoglycan biosynthesis protein ExoM
MESCSLSQQDPCHISVCICTYKRPELLADLLKKLKHQETGGQFSYSILVVDNDFQRSAESVVASFAINAALEVRYYVEKNQNISLARNMAVHNASGDFIAFIDDDEVPENDWLQRLYNALFHFGADAVLGPVVPYYKNPPPKWVIKGNFYNRPRFKTGLRIDWRKGRTGNLLLKSQMFRDTGELFNPDFGSGGEDQDFTRRMIQRGYTFVWCNEAVAYETVPPYRWTRIFLLKRALLRGQVSQRRYPDYRFYLLSRALLGIPIYTLALPVLLILGHHWFMQYLIKIMDHGGRILALMNLEPVKQKYVTE